MASAKTAPVLFLLFTFTILFLSIPSLCSSTDSFVYGGCSQQKYTPDSPYELNLKSLLTSLVNSANYSSYNNFTIMGSSPQDVVYGLYQCRGDLSMSDCATCVERAVSQVGVLCSQTCGGVLQLQGCYVKYDNATFVGVEDKTVVLKQCGPSVGYEPDAIVLRDAVLQGLMTPGGPYRVGGTGDVQGLAQCVEDLSEGECQDCLGQAIGQLMSECATADYGDMFLGKCYARYYSAGKSRAPPKPRNCKFRNGREKTITITVGSLAGVALIISFLTFIRKVPGDNGKTSPPPDNGKTSLPPDNGKTSPPPDNGKTSPPPDNGKTSPSQDNGKTSPPPDNGKTSPSPDNGKTSPPPDNGNTSLPCDNCNTTLPCDNTSLPCDNCNTSLPCDNFNTSLPCDNCNTSLPCDNCNTSLPWDNCWDNCNIFLPWDNCNISLPRDNGNSSLPPHYFH